MENEKWRSQMEQKSTLAEYNQYKNKIGADRMWKNNREETILRLMQSGAVLSKSRLGHTIEEKKM